MILELPVRKTLILQEFIPSPTPKMFFLRAIETFHQNPESPKLEALDKLERCTHRFLNSAYFLSLRDRKIPAIPLEELREKLSKIKIPLSRIIIEERRGR